MKLLNIKGHRLWPWLLFCLFSLPVLRAEPKLKLRWGEFGPHSNWVRYGYGIKSGYPFIAKLPELGEFPKLLAIANDPTLDRQDREILISQLRTLSRCEFSDLYSLSDEEGYRKAIKQWQQWWEHYGSGLEVELRKSGVRSEEAWYLVAPTPYLECPDYPIAIPKMWTSTLHFRSGDYGGVVTEVIDFKVTGEKCQLSRKYSTKTDGPLTHEVWRDFSRKEADLFVGAVIYAIDNPWFFGMDELMEKAWGPINGRPKEWIDYYPNFDWSGILDPQGSILINHDPNDWHSIGIIPNDGHPSLDGNCGVVFRIIRDMFPDPSWDPDKSRWVKVPSP